MCKRECCHCLCLQETHRSTNLTRPKIAGMSLVVKRPHNRYGSVILIRNNLKAGKIYERVQGTVEIITIVMPGVVLHSVYKPPNDPFELPALRHRNLPHIVIEDFNSHSTTWGYTSTDNEGEQWEDSCGFTLIHDAKLPKSFNSARWKKVYNQDLIFASDSIANMCKKSVMDPISHTQHRPICVSVQPVVVPQPTPFRRRFNLRKVDWNGYSTELDNHIEDVEPIPSNYNRFIENVRVAEDIYQEDVELIKIWEEVITSTNMTHNSQKAWKTINELSNDTTTSNPPCLVTANQAAHQLLVNGRGTMPSKPKRPVLPPATEGDTSKVYPFSEGEYNKGVAALKNNEATGRDDILVEQLKHLGPKAHKWLLTILNICFMDNKIPTVWRQSKIIAILKPGKDSSIPKNYRPISLLCHTYKLYERMVLNRIAPAIEQHLIKEQAGFRSGKSCTSQLLNLTQHIEDGYEEGMITGIVFVDLSATYGTVNHRLLIQKLYNTTLDSQLCRFIQNLLSDRRFYVELNNERSRWRIQKNGIPQGNVLSPTLYNIYTNDQPILDGTRSFIYADELCITA